MSAPLFAIIIAAVLLLFLLSRLDNGPLPLPPAPDDDERPTRTDLSRRWVEDYTDAAYQALDAGKVGEARHWWGVAGRSAASFEELLRREGRG